ncbi:MAG: phosphoribosylamine--glycine ligase [Candidatus Kapaibacterium sp.]
MKILLIGSGGREHAIARSCVSSTSVERLYCAPGNPGINTIAEKTDIDINNHKEVIEFCQEHEIDLVIVGPEQPLADGISDALRIAGIKVFGPSKAAARLESSKGYAKDIMQRYNIPTAAYRKFTHTNKDEAIEYLRNHPTPVVVKADGLAAGKGVVVAETTDEAISAVLEMFDGMFGAAGASVVIEEFLTGEEASVFALCDGSSFVTLAPAQDHKRALDDDQGKNTGGMGSFAPARVVNEVVLNKIHTQVIAPLLQGMQTENAPFVGCLFVGLMIDNNQPSVVEFNARFGDPETQSVLSVFEGDLPKLLHSCAVGAIDPTCVTSTANGVACTVVLASKGYPDSFEKGFPITGIDDAEKKAIVYHAGTTIKSNTLVTNGGRVLGVTAVRETLSNAIETAYSATDSITFENKYFRTDIGKKGLQHE